MTALRNIRANAIAYLALFIALGAGGAYASDKIGSSQIKSNAIRSKHIRNGQVKSIDIGTGEVRSGDIGIGAVPHTWATRNDVIKINGVAGADCANPSHDCRYLSSTAAGGGGTLKTSSLPGSKVDVFVTGTLQVIADDSTGGQIGCLPEVQGASGGSGLSQTTAADLWGSPPSGFGMRATLSFDGHVRIAQGTHTVYVDCSSFGGNVDITGGELMAWAYPVP